MQAWCRKRRHGLHDHLVVPGSTDVDVDADVDADADTEADADAQEAAGDTDDASGGEMLPDAGAGSVQLVMLATALVLAGGAVAVTAGRRRGMTHM
jgi:clumping factor B/surface protein G